MTSTPEGAWRVLVHADGTVYHVVRSEGVIAGANGVSRCEVAVFITEDGRRVGSAHLEPGMTVEGMGNHALLQLLKEVRGS